MPIDRFERHLPTALTDLAAPRTPDYLTDILGRTAATRQRPAWASIERWLPVELVSVRVPVTRLPWRQLGLLALLAILIVAMLAAYVGSRPRLPEPFGVAANGLVVFTKGGDVFVRDRLDGASRPLVATTEVEIADSLSPRGTKVAIVRPIGTDSLSLAVVPITGGDPISIGGPYRNVSGISWSPDETTIGVSHEIGGLSSITLIRTDGGGERTLDLGVPAEAPQWRPPDGRQFAFRGQVDGNWDLFIADADGSHVRRLEVSRELLEPPYEVLAPAWSPTGDRIAFHRLVLTPGNGNGNGFRIDVADVDATGALTGERTFEFDPSSDDEHTVQWLPSGDGIVFMRHDAGTDYVAVAAVEPDATARDVDVTTSTTSFGMLRYTIAPDGRTVMVHKLDDNTDWTVDLATARGVPTDIDGEDLVHIQRRAP
jgi:dipeptidyl aminopeptidase/acylaminoacyl peptidase